MSHVIKLRHISGSTGVIAWHPTFAACPSTPGGRPSLPPHPPLALSLAPPRTYGQFSGTYRRFFVTYRRLSGTYAHGILPTLSLVDALFTYGHAIAHRQVNIASIRLGPRACNSTRAGVAALLWWCMALFRGGARNCAQIRAHIRAYAGPGARSQHDRNEKPPDHINCGQAASNKLVGRP